MGSAFVPEQTRRAPNSLPIPIQLAQAGPLGSTSLSLTAGPPALRLTLLHAPRRSAQVLHVGLHGLRAENAQLHGQGLSGHHERSPERARRRRAANRLRQDNADCCSPFNGDRSTGDADLSRRSRSRSQLHRSYSSAEIQVRNDVRSQHEERRSERRPGSCRLKKKIASLCTLF